MMFLEQYWHVQRSDRMHWNWNRGKLAMDFTELQGIVNISLCRFSAHGCTYVQSVSLQRAFWDMVFPHGFWLVSSVHQQQFLLIAYLPMSLRYSNMLLLQTLCWLQAAVLAPSAKNEKRVRTTLENLVDGRNRYAKHLCKMSAFW